MAEKRIGLIFDMDGVLIDSNPVHRDAWVAYNRSQGVETTEAMQQIMYGKRNDQILREFLGNELTDAEVFAHGAAKEKLFREMIGPQLPGVLVKGVREFVERHRDFAIGCATNADRENLEFVLRASGIEQLFDAAVDGHQVANPKPWPDIYLRAAALLGIEPAKCIVFEDSFTGIEAAQAAGMRVVGVQTTHRYLPDVDFSIRDFDDPGLEAFVSEFAARVQ